jgi:cytoskeletal protein RodZ
MSSIPVGSEFTSVRESKGLEINQVSQLLKIKPQKIIALEQDLYEGCALNLYDIGYINSYATLLNIDPQVIQNKLSLRGFKIQHTTSAPKKQNRKKHYYKIIALVLLFIAIYYIDKSPASYSYTEPSQHIAKPFGYSEN